MSEPIIIETPAPPTRERLVLVPPESVSIVRENGTVIGLSIRANNARDATTADLARGGWVPLSAFVGPLGLLSPPTLAGALEAVEGIRQDADRWEHLESEQRSRVTSYLEERDEAVERAEKAEGLLIQRETELRLAREDGDESARGLRQAYERAVAAAEKAEAELADLRPAPRGMTVREAARARHALGGPDAQALEGALVQAERERDEAIRRGIECIGAGPTNIENVVARLVNIVEASRGIEKDYAARLKAAETELARLMQERDTLRAEVAEASKALLEAGCGSALPLARRVALLVGACARLRAGMRGAKELARVLEVERDEAKAGHNAVQPRVYALEAELADAKAECAGAMLSAHAQYAETVRERDTLRAELSRLTAPASEGVSLRDAQPAKDRATDEELVAIAIDAWTNEPGFIHAALRATALRVAARVRQERCLVAQAVADPLLDSVSVGAVMGGGIRVRIVRRVDSLANTLGETKDVFCERADVPSTLARLLGEVSR